MLSRKIQYDFVGYQEIRDVSIDGIPVAASCHEKLLQVTIDSEFKLQNNITELHLKVSKKT